MHDPRPVSESARPNIRVGVFGHYGRHNLGDESLTAAVIANVRRLAPDSQIIGFSLDPKDTAARHGVSALAIRSHVTRFPSVKPEPLVPGASQRIMGFKRRMIAAIKRIAWLRTLYHGVRKMPSDLLGVAREFLFFGYMWQALSGVDLLLIAGSNQMIDYVGGAWEFPYTLCKWALLAGLRGVRVAFVSVGAGPLDGKLSRYFVRKSLSRAVFVSVRDHGSQQLVRNLGYTGDVRVSPDLAFSLPWSEGGRSGSRGGPGVVAVNPMPVFDARYWPESDPVRYRRYVDALAALCTCVIAGGQRVVLFGTHPADEWVADDILVRLSSETLTCGRIELARPRSLAPLLDLVSQSDAVVATRFHGILLSLLVGTPTVGICYYRKSRELMETAGVGEFAIDFEEVDVTALVTRLKDLAMRRAQIVETLQRTAHNNRELLERQYEAVLSVATGPRK
jgi:polysaccharide pyruvyl transferase WcaK-like protein